MRDPLSKVTKEIKPSGIRKFFDIVSEMPDAISLGVGEPDFDTPWRVREEGIYSLERGRTFYTSNAGLKELRYEISEYLERKYELVYDPNHEIIVTVGGSEGIDIAMRTILDPGDEVIVVQPCFVSYVACVVMAGGTPVIVSLKEEDKFKLKKEQLEAAVTDKTKAMIISFPNNPTGAAFNTAQLKAWIDYAIANKAIIIYDAAYEAFITQDDIPRSIFQVEGARQCAIEICSLSKTAGFTGMRCGYTVIPNELEVEASDGTKVSISQLWGRRQGSKFNGVSYPVQCGAAAVFSEEGREQIKVNLEYYKENARIIANTMDKLGISYTGGINSPYIWLKCPNGMGSWEFFDLLLKEANVVGTPGEGFGKNGKGYFRLTSFGDRDATIEAMARIEKLLSK